MKNKYLQLFLISNILIILDQFTKYLVALHIPQNMSIRIIDNFFNLTHIRNPGVAFGLFAESELEMKATLFIIFSGIAIIAILVFFHETPSHKKIALRGLILIFAGAIGNLIDRILYKEVIDFLDFHFGSYHWPAFNVADSCITIGVLFMFIDIIKDGTAPQKRQEDPTSESA
ncbi:signal peptidase II [Nitrospina sp. 32_T5]|uniref:signal peptidase II n=1 Tax=unclassified Nitrospina TaxID=2638683 RepID=UPI003F9D045C